MLIRKKCTLNSLGDDSVAVKATERMPWVEKKAVVPNFFTGTSESVLFFFLMISIKLNVSLLGLIAQEKIKNNPDKSLIFVTLPEFKWKAGAEEVLLTSILFHLSCLVKSPGP